MHRDHLAVVFDGCTVHTNLILVPWLHPIFSMSHTENGRAWFVKSRAQHWAKVNLMNVGRIQNGVLQNLTRYRATVQSASVDFPVAEMAKMLLERPTLVQQATPSF